MLKGFKYRIYPNKNQSLLIYKHIDSCRFIYNLSLETKQFAYTSMKVNLTRFDLIKQLPDLKIECKWLKLINSQSLQCSIMDLDNSFKRFFKGAGFPRFKSKNDGKKSFSISQNVKIENNKFCPFFCENLQTEHTNTENSGTFSKISEKLV